MEYEHSSAVESEMMEVEGTPPDKPISTPAPKSSRRKSVSVRLKKKTLKRKKVKIEEGSAYNEEQNEGEYAVERIVDKKTVDGVALYFIKWQGWPEESNTWEPIDHLGNCHQMIQEYENKLKSAGNKKSGKRGRSNSATSSVASSPTPKSNRGRKAKKEEPIEEYPSDDDDHFSGVDDGDEDLTFGILNEVPADKELEKIHAVAVVDGYLTFLVQWKDDDSVEHTPRPPISGKNSNMVRAMSMNKRFPQEVISFYETRVNFNLNLEPYENEALKAAKALMAAKERRFTLSLKRQGYQPDDLDLDPASLAIEKENQTNDPFDPLVSDLSSSSSDSNDDDDVDPVLDGDED